MIVLQEPSPGRPYATIAADPYEPIDALGNTMLKDAYKSFGAVLLRGFSMDIAAFGALTARCCSTSVFNESLDRDVLDAEHNIQTVNQGAEAFPLHPELSREPWKPDVCFFWCITPPARGGETTICDGVELVRHMPPPVRKIFEDHDLCYNIIARPEALKFWLGDASPNDTLRAAPPADCPFTFSRHQDKIIRSFQRPALHKPMFCDDLAFGNFLLFARYLLGWRDYPVFDGPHQVPDRLLAEVKCVADKLTVPILWQAGDVVMLDNTRFMHGRNAVSDPTHRKIATYFGYLNFAVAPDDEPKDAIWRRSNFRPPTVRPATANAGN
jgi:hypothetical protein